MKSSCYYCGLPGHIARNCQRKAAGLPRVESAKVAKEEETENALVALVGQNSTALTREWVMDTACTSHITDNPEVFTEKRPISPRKICWGNHGTFMLATAVGSVHGEVRNSAGNVHMLEFTDVLYVPGFGTNLLSVKQLNRDDIEELFTRHGAQLFNSRGDSLGLARTSPNGKDLFILDMTMPICQELARTARAGSSVGSSSSLPSGARTSENIPFLVSTKKDALLLHERMCHMGVNAMKRLIPSLNDEQCQGILDCAACIARKMTRRPFPSVPEKYEAANAGEVLCMDTCHIGQKSAGGCYLWLIIVDEKTKFLRVIPLAAKDQSVGEIIKFAAWNKSCGNTLKSLRSDNGDEFYNKALEEWCTENGVVQELCTPYTPQQNGTAERANRTVLNAIRTMLASPKVAHKFWAEAVNAFQYTYNIVPRQNSMIPFAEFTHKAPPPVLPYKVGAPVTFWLHRKQTKAARLQPPGHSGVFLGPAIMGHIMTPGSYRVWDGYNVWTVADLKGGSLIRPPGIYLSIGPEKMEESNTEAQEPGSAVRGPQEVAQTPGIPRAVPRTPVDPDAENADDSEIALARGRPSRAYYDPQSRLDSEGQNGGLSADAPSRIEGRAGKQAQPKEALEPPTLRK